MFHSKQIPSAICLTALFCFGFVRMVKAADTTDSKANTTAIQFNRDIRPILSENCFSCHGPDKHSRQADLRLDERDAAVAMEAIVPGDVNASSIIDRILAHDEGMMPPEKTGKKLNETQIGLLKAWIEQGATYQSHWSFNAIPEKVELPNLESTAKSGETVWNPKQWAKSEIDFFVANNLAKNGLAPSPETDKARWLRRATLDLTGLPPSLEELDAFLADQSELAYENAVDTILARETYGERMANAWLDVARYADTFGYQADVEMEVWPWRDWVIRSFNENLPYDRFIVWQTAGDLLPNATQEQRLATAFNRLHRQTNEGGSIEEEFRQVYIADRTVTNGTAFLGLTLECSRCHDHKYDPILQSDFYSLAAYLNNIDEHGLYSHFTRTAPTPAMLLYSGDQEQQHRTLLDQIRSKEQEHKESLSIARKHYLERMANSSLPVSSDTKPDDSDNADTKPTDAEPAGIDWTPPKPDLYFPLEGDVDGVVQKASKLNGDDSIACKDALQYGRYTPLSVSLWIKPAMHAPRLIVLHQSVAAEDSAFRGLQLTLNEGHPQFSLIHFWPGNAIRVESIETLPIAEWSHVAVTYDGSSKANGIRVYINGAESQLTVDRDQLTRDILHRKEWSDSNAGGVGLALGARFRDTGFRDGCLDDLKVFHRQLSTWEVAKTYYEVRPEEKKTIVDLDQKQKAWQQDDYVTNSDPAVQSLSKELSELREKENELVTMIRQIMVMKQAERPRITRILNRGAYDSPGDIVKPKLPSFLAALTQKKASDATSDLRSGSGLDNNSQAAVTTEASNVSSLADVNTANKVLDNQHPMPRLAFANWLVSQSNPLVSRVTVNRYWHIFFGRGIVASLEDFGSQGQPPTHPELLDWLARDFMDHGWNVKRLCKQIVLSSAYRQSSSPTNPELFQKDPDNRLLARGPRHRLSAEQVRDASLFATGLLAQKIGGPSVMPYQPAGLWEEAGTGKSYNQATGEGLYRRSLYTFWRRTAPPPSMLTFDATSRETCNAKRELTSTPLQSLILLNDPQYVEAARVLSERLISNHNQNIDARWHETFRRLISRNATGAEIEILNSLYQSQIEYFRTNGSSANEFVSVGAKPRDEKIDIADLAATAVVVKTILNYDEAVMKR